MTSVSRIYFFAGEILLENYSKKGKKSYNLLIIRRLILILILCNWWIYETDKLTTSLIRGLSFFLLELNTAA